MIHVVTISYQAVLDEAAAQTALDFRALRSVDAGRAGADPDDFTMSEDNAREVFLRIEEVAATLCVRMPEELSIKEWTATSVTFSADVRGAGTTHPTVCVLLKRYFVSEVLAWWYAGRNEALQGENALRASELLRALRSQLEGAVCERRLRFF